MRVFLRERMDQLFKVLQVKDQLLFDRYRSARKIHKKRGRRSAGKPYKVLLNIGATKSMRLRASIKTGDTKIKLSTHTKTATTDVVVYFSATAAGPQQGEGLVLQPNSKVETTATLLGWSPYKPHLCAKNLGVGRHTVGVVVVG